VQIATVFSGTGLTFGTVAGILMADIILGRPNAWRELYRSSRVNTEAKVNEPVRSIVIAGGRSMTSHDTSRLHRGSPEEPLDEDSILEIDGEKIAAYRDNREALHALSTRCTPMGSNVEWNGAAKTWDCRCHGGRYRATGEVLCAPPTQSLARLKIP
jgi:Rieske Fe-S protein